MNLVIDEISQPSTTVSSDSPATTFRNVVGRCYLSWDSIQSKYKRDRDHINPELVPDLVTIMLSQKSMVTIAGITYREAHDSPNRLNSMTSLEKQNRETTCQVNSLIKTVSEWSSVPQAVHDGLSLCATTLEKQRMDLALLYFSTGNNLRGMSDSDRDHWSCLVIHKRQLLSRKLNAWKQRLATAQEGDCHMTNASDSPSTQPTPGMMTPLEGWTDVGSDTTETISKDFNPIRPHDLSAAAKHTEKFARFLELFSKTGFRDTLRSTAMLEADCAPVTVCVRRRYSEFANDLEQLLHMTRRESSLEHVSSAHGSPLPSRETAHAVQSQGASDCHEDRALEAIFNEIGSEVTNEDVARLARHWAS